MKSAIITPTVYYGIVLTTTGTLQLTNGTTQIGSDSSALSTGQWYRVEISYAYATGAVSAKINGASAFASGTTIASKAIDRMYIGCIDSPASGEWYIDDVAVNNSAGSYQNDFPGDGKIVHLHPNQDDANVSWIRNSGTNNRYTYVNEVPVDDATTYLYHNTINTYNGFTIENPTWTGTVNALHVGWRYQRSGSGAAAGTIALTSAGQTAAYGTCVTPQSTWNTNANVAPKLFPITLYLDPSGATWGPTALNDILIDVWICTTGTPSFRLTNTWVAVDYTPAEADVTPPTLTSATIATTGDSISLLFDEAVTIGAGGNGGWTATMSLGNYTTLTYSSGSGTNTLVYTITGRTVLSGETGTISYTQPVNGIEDLSGNDLATIASASITNNSTQTDTTPPTLTSATIPASGTSINLLFNEYVKFGAGGNGGWTLSMSGGAVTMTYYSGTTSNTLVYSLSRTIGSSETGTVSYTQPGNGVEDYSGNDKTNVSSASVINNSTGAAPSGDALLLGGD